MKTIIRVLISAGVAFMLTKVLSGVYIENFSTAVIFALVLSALNTIVTPIFKFIGFPITLFTLGFFSLVINASIILLADYFVGGMNVNGFWWAFVFSIALSLISSLLNNILN